VSNRVAFTRKLYVARQTFNVARLTFYVARQTFYVARLTFYVARLTFYVLIHNVITHVTMAHNLRDNGPHIT
jgi:hypothetical protein